MTRYLPLTLLLLGICCCIAQHDNPIEAKKDELDLSFINNEKLEYGIGLRACDNCAPIVSIGYRVSVFLEEDKEEIIEKITSDIWFELLNDSTSDFAANIILYSLYDKNAAELSMNDNESEWRRDMKSEDLDYWKLNLK